MKTALLAIMSLVLLGGSVRATPVVPLQPFMKPVIDPSSPIAGEPIVAHIRTYACVAFTAPAHFQIARNGSDITLTIDGFVNFGAGCNLPDVTTAWEIGALPAGNYRLAVLVNDELYPTEPIAIDTAVTDFVVLAAHGVPVGEDASWMMLAAAIALVAAGALARRP